MAAEWVAVLDLLPSILHSRSSTLLQSPGSPMYIKVPPQPFIRRRKRVRFGPPPAPPTALTLVAAEYNHDDSPVLVLTFDRAIDIAGLDGSQMIVDDGFDLGLKFVATGPATLDGPAILRIGLTDDGD